MSSTQEDMMSPSQSMTAWLLHISCFEMMWKYMYLVAYILAYMHSYICTKDDIHYVSVKDLE